MKNEGLTKSELEQGWVNWLICRDNNGVHARPLGSSGVEHRPDGATTQEVYNMAKNVFNHQTSSEKLAAWPEPAAILKMKTNVWGRGQTEHHIYASTISER